MNEYQQFLVRRLYELQMDYAYREPMLVGDFRAHYRHWLYCPYPVLDGLLDFFYEHPKTAAMYSLLSQYRTRRIHLTEYMISIRADAAYELNCGNPYFLRSIC